MKQMLLIRIFRDKLNYRNTYFQCKFILLKYSVLQIDFDRLSSSSNSFWIYSIKNYNNIGTITTLKKVLFKKYVKEEFYQLGSLVIN